MSIADVQRIPNILTCIQILAFLNANFFMYTLLFTKFAPSKVFPFNIRTMFVLGFAEFTAEIVLIINLFIK